MTKYKSIPITAARDIAKKYGKSQVIVVAWDPVHGKEHVTTYGTNKEQCRQAALGGDRIKAALNWPQSLEEKTAAETIAAQKETIERLSQERENAEAEVSRQIEQHDRDAHTRVSLKREIRRLEGVIAGLKRTA